MANTKEISPGIFTTSYGKNSNIYNFQSIGKSSVVDTVPTTLVPSSKVLTKVNLPIMEIMLLGDHLMIHLIRL